LSVGVVRRPESCELSDVHKIIWRGPYIKAPVGAPMLAAEKVYSVE
jgi:hypothetical protein